MSAIATAVVGTSLVTGYMGAQAQGDAADTAAAAQRDSSQAGIEQQKLSLAQNQKQFEAMQEILKPYNDRGRQALGGLMPYEQAGSDALWHQRAILGLDGPESQQRVYDQIANSPAMQAGVQQGENAILQNASATGGLRGGNTQATLAQFRPQMLAQLINQQYGQLGGMTQMGNATTSNIAQIGQASAAGTGAAGMQTAAMSQQGANSITQLLGQQGAATAGQALANGNATAGMWGNIGGTAGMLGTMKLMGKF